MPHNKYRIKIRPIIFVIGPSIAYVDLGSGYYCIIDNDDAAFIGQWNWHVDAGEEGIWAKRTKRISECNSRQERKSISMHREILITDAPHVDHKDGNGLNNCRYNLRPASRAQNANNSKLRSTNKSGYKGVFLHRPGKWTVRIRANGASHYLGMYDSPEAAYAAYCEAALRLHGEYARLH